MSENDQISMALDVAGVPTRAGRSNDYTTLERIRVLVTSRDYFLKECDKARAERDELKKEREELASVLVGIEGDTMAMAACRLTKELDEMHKAIADSPSVAFILEQLEASVQDLRERGETDLRSVLSEIKTAKESVKRLL